MAHLRADSTKKASKYSRSWSRDQPKTRGQNWVEPKLSFKFGLNTDLAKSTIESRFWMCFHIQLRIKLSQAQNWTSKWGLKNYLAHQLCQNYECASEQSCWWSKDLPKSGGQNWAQLKIQLQCRAIKIDGSLTSRLNQQLSQNYECDWKRTSEVAHELEIY